MNESPIIFAFVGRSSGPGTSEVWASAYGDAVKVANAKEGALQMIVKVEGRPGKFSFQIDQSRAAYALVASQVVYGAIVNSKKAMASAVLEFLARLRDQFETSYSKTERDYAPPGTSNFTKFSHAIDKEIREFYAGDLESVDKVKGQLDEARSAMALNIDRVLERGERLDTVVAKSDNMRESALTFNRKGRALRRHMWYKNFKFQLLIAALFLILVFVIFLAACRGFACVT